MRAVRDARQLLNGCKAELHIIGDAKSPRNLMLAISEGEELARAL
jgi:hypothetical protein